MYKSPSQPLSQIFLSLLLVLLVMLLFRLPFRAQAGEVVIGDGTAASCTEAALDTALAGGGEVTFNCGSSTHVITLTGEKVIAQETSLDGGNLIILNGNSSVRLFRVAQDVTFAVSNMALQNGRTSAEGGAIYADENTTLTVNNVTFTNNVSTQTAENYAGGGAIAVERRSQATIIDSDFSSNQAGNGGAIAIGGWNADDDGGTLLVQGSSFTGNFATEDGGIAGGGDGGGAIYLKGGVAATIENSEFTNNQAPNGGAIHLLGADVTVRGSTFSGNQARHNFEVGGGGVLYMDGTKDHAGEVRIEDSTFTDNSSNRLGGAIFSFPEGTGQTVILRSTFDGNWSQERGQGGAIYHQSATGNGALRVEASTFTNNYADATGSASQGGALWLHTAPVTILNSTFYQNDATSSDGSLAPDNWWRGFGGALVNHATLEIINSTFAENSAGFVGGALAGDEITLRNSLIANNTAANPWDIQQNCTDELINGGGNLQYPQKTTSLGNDYECLAGQTAVNPLLGAFGNYGGATDVLPLLDGSPAIDAGDNGVCPAADQRGFPRGDGHCDIGAVEASGGLLLTSISPSLAAADEAADFTLTVRGAGFTSSSTVRWNGSDRPTTFVSSFEIQAAIAAADVSTVGTASVTVVEDGEESDSLPFTIVESLSRRFLPFIRTN